MTLKPASESGPNVGAGPGAVEGDKPPAVGGREAPLDFGAQSALLDTFRDAFVAINADGVVTGWNSAAERMFGYAAADALGEPMAQLIIPAPYVRAHDEGVRRFLATRIPTLMGTHHEVEAVRKSGEVFPVEITHWWIESDGEIAFYAFIRDISERRAAEAELSYRRAREAELTHRTLHDELTGLSNRTLAVDHLSEALVRRDRYGGDLAVLFVDLDRFKLVNDSLGHEAGDQVLRTVAYRLSTAVRDADTVARVAGDEFVIVCDELTSREEATQIARRVLATVRVPINIAGTEVRVGASIGIAFADGLATGDVSLIGGGRAEERLPARPAVQRAETLFNDADAAMYRVKEQGRGHILVFDDTMRRRRQNRLELETELRACVDNDQLRLRLQPIVDVRTGKPCGAGLMVWWQHPQHGLLPPSQFLPVAEETGSVLAISNWTLDRGLRHLSSLVEQGFSEFMLSANLSLRHVAQQRFTSRLQEALVAHGVAPARIELSLEIPPLFPPHDATGLMAAAGAIEQIGVQLSLQGVGAGYAAMPALAVLAPRRIKIAPELIDGIATDDRKLAIVRSLTDLAHRLSMEVTAVGVDTPEQRDAVVAAGCDCGQGAAFGPLLGPDQFTRWLSKECDRAQASS